MVKRNMGQNEELTLAKFEEACETVSRVTLDTSLIFSDYFSEKTGGKVYLKPENRQRTGAYKVRGAYYKISTLSEEERSRGLITASAGNHAQGVAYAARQFGAKAVIVMPTTTPLIKVNRTKALGAEVVLFGDVYDEACAYALQLAEENGYTFIHPFDDPDVAAGQGTIAMEIVKDLPLVDIILVPVGGGGLATGVSTLAKMLKPNIKVIGVEPEGAACLKASFEAGHVVTVPAINTIADGTAVKTPGEKIFPYLQKNLDDVITVSDAELVVSFLDMVENHKMIVENSGLLSVAALKHIDCKGKKVVSVLHVERGAAGLDHERQDLYNLRPSAGQTRRTAQGLRHYRGSQRQRDQTRAQPVRLHQPQCGSGIEDHAGSFWHRTQTADHQGTC